MSESELRAEIAGLRGLNARFAAYRRISQRLLDASALEEVGSIVVGAVVETFGAGGAVMVLAAGSHQEDPGPWVYGDDDIWRQIPEATRKGVLDLLLQGCQPIVEADAAAFLARHHLPPAPSLAHLLVAPLCLGVLCLGAVIAYNFSAPQNLSRYADDAVALLGPVPSAISHTWLLEARAHEARLLESIIQNVDTHISYLDRDFRFLRVNQAYAKGSGHSVEELIGRKHFDLFPNQENQAIFERVRDTGEPVHFVEKPFVYADQPERGVTYWDWTLTPLKDAQGRVAGFAFALGDRTEQVRHRQQAEAIQQERLREGRVVQTILENASSVVIYLDRDFRVRLANAAAQRALGLGREEMLGRKITELIPEAVKQVPVESIIQQEDGISGRQLALSWPDAPERGVTYWDWTAVPVVDQEGGVDGIVITGNEVTEEVKARERIAKSERARAREARLLRTVQESTDSNLVYFDQQLRVVQANSAFLTTANKTRGEVVGKTIREILPNSQDLHALLQQTRTDREPVVIHEMMREPLPWMSQLRQYWDFAFTPIRDETGEVEGIVVSGVDVTGQVYNRERLLEEERNRTRLAEALNAELNHRVKNNLAMVAGLLQMQIADRPKEDAAAGLLRESIARLRAIAAVHEQLNETQVTEVEVVDAIRRIARASQQVLMSDQVGVSVQGEPVFLPSRSATTLCVVVNELLTNAMKHGAAHPSGARTVRVSVQRGGGKLRLGVWNSGNAVVEDFDFAAQSQMGLRLVRGIVLDQFRGSFSLTPADSGTLAQVTVSESALNE